MQDEMTKQMAAALGIAALSLEKQQEVIVKFGEIALKAATLSIIGKLTEEKRSEFMTLADQGDEAAVKAFLDRELPDHETLASQAVGEEIRRFKEAGGA
ncbi:MAG: DUF5663 domain-containing protein [Candidatus Paceibacterota bacterium]